MRAWYENAIFYSIYPLGAVTSQHENDYVLHTDGMTKLGDWAEHIRSIGCNAVYFGPVFESQTHGYDSTDYRKIDSRLGTNEQFGALVEQYHRAGIRVVVDGVFNHTGRDFFAFQDLRQNREHSDYRDWYRGVNFGGDNPLGDGFDYEAWRGHFELPRLNPHCSGVTEYLFDAVRMWIRDFDIDGIRLDCADCLDFGFMRDLRKVCLAEKPDFWLMGEIIHGDYSKWANADTLHSVTNYECSKGLYSSHNDGNMHEIAYSINRQFGNGGVYQGLCLYNFADNHDLNRIADTVENPAYLPTLYTILYTMPGVPSVYYGSEWGLRGVTDRVTDWALRPEVDIASARFDDPELMRHIAKLARVRAVCPPFCGGDYAQLAISSHQYAFRRAVGADEVLVLVNIADTPQTICVPASGDRLFDLLGEGEEFAVQSGRVEAPTPAHGSRILYAKPLQPNAPEQAPAARTASAEPPASPEPKPEPGPTAAPASDFPARAESPVLPEPVKASGGVRVVRWGDEAPVRCEEHPVYVHDRQDAVTTERCAVAFYELAPGKSAYPYHSHSANEEVYYLLSGAGMLRTPDADKQVSAGDLIHFPAGEAGAHRLINTTHEPLRYLDFDVLTGGDVAFFPDSRKASLGGKCWRIGEETGYYDGE